MAASNSSMENFFKNSINWADLEFVSFNGAQLLLALILAIIGIVFVTFYLSRVVGFFLTLFLRWRYGAWVQGKIGLGSFSLSLLSGKLMFRDAKLITADFSLRVQDGWLIFRYWKIFTPIKLGADFSRQDARVNVQLNGLEAHVYNRSGRYRELDTLFGLGVGGDSGVEAEEADEDDEATWEWEEELRGLVPVIRYEVSSGRLLFGNATMPATLLLSFENAQGTYTTKKPSSSLDWFMHSIHGTCENFRLSLVRTPSYAGSEWEDPPRLMGDGFVVVQTAQLDFYHYQDRLGRVKEGEQDLSDPVGPVWGTDLRLGKNTALSFGPWADKHRERLYSFFFPGDFQNQLATSPPTKGQSRVFTSYSLGVVTLNDATADVVFLRGEDPNALHLNFKAGSSLQLELPWTVADNGFLSSVKGLLMHTEVATSLEYRQLVEAETIQFEILMHYPRQWDGLQVWDFNFSASKATAWIVYSVKTFIQDLLDEWAGNGAADVRHFVPYRWNFALELRDFELILLLNSHNWIDTSSQNEENIQAAVRGAVLDLSFGLPFDKFLPESMETRLCVDARRLELALFIPPQFVMSQLYGSLEATSAEMVRDLGDEPRWSNVTDPDRGWSTLWWAPSVLLSFSYVLHPAPGLPEGLVLPELATGPNIHDFDPRNFEPDVITVEVELGPSKLRFCGLIIKYLMSFKENYLGENQEFVDVSTFASQVAEHPYGRVSEASFDWRLRRALSVQCSVLLRRIEAHAMIFDGIPTPDGPTAYPIAYIPQLAFEMDKTHEATELQLVVGPTDLRFAHLPDAHLHLSGFQFRGHALFSDAGLPVDAPTTEYGWLVELVAGSVRGTLSPPCLCQLTQLVEGLLLMLLLEEDEVAAPSSLQLCQHQEPRSLCGRRGEAAECQGEEALKYKLVRLSVDEVEISVREGSAAVAVRTSAVRLATCTLHKDATKDGVTLQIPSASVRAFLSHGGESLEAAAAEVVGTRLDVALPTTKDSTAEASAYLRTHDSRTRRLHFLWNGNMICGCLGNCVFYGENTAGKAFFSSPAPLGELRSDSGPRSYMQSLLRPFTCLLDADSVDSPGAFTSEDSDEFVLASEGWDTPLASCRHSQASFRSSEDRQKAEDPLTTPAILDCYARSMDAYAEDTEGRFRLKRPGLNGASLVADPFKADAGGTSQQRRLDRWLSSQESRGKLQAPEKLHVLEVNGLLGGRVRLFASPLGGAVGSRLAEPLLAQALRRHPLHLLQSLFSDCSQRRHRQPLSHKLSMPSPVVLVGVSLPRLDATTLLCFRGAESGRLETMLFSSAVLNSSLSAKTHIQELEKRPEQLFHILAAVDLEAAYGQLVKVSSGLGASGGGGISRNASRIPFYCDWSTVEGMAGAFQPCVVLETGVTRVAGRANLQLGPDADPKSKAPPMSTSSEEDGSGESEILVEVGPILANFGLLQPLEESGWPLYDLLAPVVGTWIRAGAGLLESVEGPLGALALRRELLLAWILTEALDGEEAEERPPRSRLAMAKSMGPALRACPSCQLLVLLLRYARRLCSRHPHLDVLSLVEGREGLEVRPVQKALVSLLSHWRTVLCAESLVSIDAAMADRFLDKEEIEADFNSDSTKIVVEEEEESPENDAIAAKADALNTESLLLLTPDEELPSPMAERQASIVSVNASLNGRAKRGRPDSARQRSTPRAVPAASREDLYQWMKEQQKEAREAAKRKGPYVHGSGSDVNPMDIPLNVYFAPIYESQDLELRRAGIPLLEICGSRLSWRIRLKEMKVGTIEPKLLNMVAFHRKKFGYTERHLIGFDSVEIKGLVKYEPEMVEAGLFPCRKSTLHVNYHVHCDKTLLTVGFPSASAVSQLKTVAKAGIEIYLGLAREASAAKKTRLTALRRFISRESRRGSQEREEWWVRMLGMLKDYQRSRRHGSSRSREAGKPKMLTPSLILFGVVDFKLISLQAIMTELIMFVTMNGLQFGHSFNERRSFDLEDRKASETSVTGSLQKVVLILLEGEHGAEPPPASRHTILNVTLDASSAIYSTSQGGRRDEKLMVELGPVVGDVPMHPGFLHGVVLRTSRNFQKEIGKLNLGLEVPVGGLEASADEPDSAAAVAPPSAALRRPPEGLVSLNISLKTIRLKAQLLPSVWARYEMSGVRCLGTVGAEAKLAVEIPDQGIEFCVASGGGSGGPIQLHLPAFSVDLDRVDCRPDESPERRAGETLVYQEGEYWKVEVAIGKFEHTLTTYLLNQILFVQEAFRREVGEILSRISAERPAFLPPSSSPRPRKPLLYALAVRGPANAPIVQLTATTPTATALRFTVDQLSGRLTNRWVSGSGSRIHGKVELGLSLILGQLVKAATYEEVEAEFQQFAYFKTRVEMRNVESGAAEEETLSYTYIVRVIRPIVFVQKSGVDKAVLLWLNYKNTYNFWSKERHQIRTRGPAAARASLTPTAAVSLVGSPLSEEMGAAPLFLKLTVDSGLYVCMPLLSPHYSDTNAALLLSLDKTHISVCSLGSLVSQGSFTGFCIRFAEDFDSVSENWCVDAGQRTDSNFCYVPEGTYEVCSKTLASPAPEWNLNVQWGMKGMDLQLNSRIGAMTSLLLSTLTSLADDQGDEHQTVPGSSDVASMSTASEAPQSAQDAAAAQDGELEERLRDLPPGKPRTKAIEKAMNEQALLVSALRNSREASEATIEIERRRLARWEAALFSEFRREMLDKFRRQSQKATSLRDRLGLSVKAPSSLERTLPSMASPGRSRESGDPGLAGRRQSDTSGYGRGGGLLRTRGHQRAGSLDGGSLEGLPPIIQSRSVSVEDEEEEGSRHWSEVSEDSGSSQNSSPPVRWRRGSTDAVEKLTEDDRPSHSSERGTGPSASDFGPSSGAETEAPVVNIFLDVAILIESGSATLSTSGREEEATPRQSKTKSKSKLQPPPVTKTVIVMPSLSLRSYYTSKAATEGMGGLGKRAQFYLYTALESMPEETVITPHLMSFFEEALEPLSNAQNSRLSSLAWRDEGSNAELVQEEIEEPPPSATSGGGLVVAVAGVSVEVILYFLVQSSTIRFTTTSNPTITGVECLLRLPSLHLAFTKRDAAEEEEALAGGMHCSASFKDFSLAIFHPYGAAADPDAPRKDYLTLTVDAIAFNFSRSRNVITASRTRDEVENSVKFSVIVDINKAYFNYDMRRLKDILSFPKAWYRKAIARRFFLGDESAAASTLPGNSGLSVPEPSLSNSRRSTPKPPPASTTPLQSPVASKGSAWDALGLLQFHFAELRLDAEMGGTMGQTSWITKELNTRGRVGLTSGGQHSLEGEFSMACSQLHASRGIISGKVDLDGMKLTVAGSRTPDKPPSNSIRLHLLKAETQVDWMSSQILIAHATDFSVQIGDEWRVELDEDGEVLVSRVDLLGKIHWSDLCVIITRKTVNDFFRIYLKLVEFFEQQVKRTRQILTIPLAREGAKLVLDPEPQCHLKFRYHHHWQKVLRLITEIQWTESYFPLPKQNTIVSGNFELEGKEISLSCIHGSGKGTFQMMGQGQWALFHLIQPSVSFDASAMYVVATDADGDPTTDTLINQLLRVQLGGHGHQQRVRSTRAIVARVQQGRKQAPRMAAPVQEWLDYMQRGVVAGILGTAGPSGQRGGDHSVSVLFKLPAFDLSLDSLQQQPEEEPPAGESSAVVKFGFIADFQDHLYISSNVESIYFLHDLVSAYMQEKGPGGRSGTEAEAEEGAADARSFESLAWRLEPTIRFLESQSTDIIGVDFVLKKLGFDNAKSTIPKWIQRGAMDPLDAVIAQLLHKLLVLARRTPS